MIGAELVEKAHKLWSTPVRRKALVTGDDFPEPFDCSSEIFIALLFSLARERRLKILMFKRRRHALDLVLGEAVPRGFVTPL